MLLIKIFRAFNHAKVRYLVVGGVAGVLYGNPRFTKDLDVWVDADEENLEKIVKCFKRLNFIPRSPVEPKDFISLKNRDRWKKEKGMLAFTFLNPKNPFESVDLLFDGPVKFETAFKAKNYFKAKQTAIPTISGRHLIQMKRKAGRYQDLEDVKILSKVFKMRRSK